MITYMFAWYRTIVILWNMCTYRLHVSTTCIIIWIDKSNYTKETHAVKWKKLLMLNHQTNTRSLYMSLCFIPFSYWKCNESETPCFMVDICKGYMVIMNTTHAYNLTKSESGCVTDWSHLLMFTIDGMLERHLLWCFCSCQEIRMLQLQ